jgi:imidazolonepropionase-like amidohydrolase
VRVAVHTFGEAGVRVAVEAGVDSVEHGCGLEEDLVDKMAADRIAMVPTMVNVADGFESIAGQAEAKFPRYAAHMRRLQQRFPDVVRAAHDAGVPIFAGSDAGGGIAHGQIAEEILLLHQAGLTPVEALGAGSWAAREWLGIDGLVEGGPADLVVYDEDPRRDLGVLRSPRRIVLRGAVVA